MNVALHMSTKHSRLQEKVALAPKNDNRIHTRCTWTIHHTIYCQCVEVRKKTFSISKSGISAQISLFQIYQLQGGWTGDDLFPADLHNIIHFSGTALRANCSASASRVLAELQALSTPAFVPLQNLLQNALV